MTNVAIGTNKASSKLEVRSSNSSQQPIVVKNHYGQTKLLVHSNGGVSIGNALNPPVDGLAIENHLKMNFYK